MTEWKSYKLADVCSRIRSGKAISATSVSPNGKYAVVGGNGVRGYTEKSNFKGQCVVVGRQGAYCGNVRYFDGEFHMTEHAVVIIGNEYADTHYLAYLLSTMELGHLSAQSAQPGLSIQTLSKLDIYLPPLSQQQRIVDLLGALDHKIEINRRINDNLEQQAQTLYKSWFVDFEPFKDGEFIESELGQIPEGWQCIPFSMFVSESKAKTGKIGIKEYSVTNNGIFPRDAKYNKSLSQSSTKNKLILYGDLVFGMSRDILNWGVMQEEQGGVSSAYTVYNINSGIVNSTYLELFIKSRIHLFSDLIRPAAREGQGIDKSVLQTKVLLCPPQEVLDTFWPLYNSVTNQIQTTTTEINCLGDVRDTLLPKLMSGELTINEIDC